MIFEDRLSAYPNRYLLTNSSGDTMYVTLERADDPIKVGTPLNAETFNGMQEEIQIESDDYPGCFYRMVGNSQVWINPPMEKGVFYPTTECYNGKPVMRVAFEGTLTSAPEDTFTVAGLIANAIVIGFSGSVGKESPRGYYPLNYYYGDSQNCFVSTYGNQVVVSHPAWMEGHTLRLVLKFVVG